MDSVSACPSYPKTDTVKQDIDLILGGAGQVIRKNSFQLAFQLAFGGKTNILNMSKSLQFCFKYKIGWSYSWYLRFLG